MDAPYHGPAVNGLGQPVIRVWPDRCGGTCLEYAVLLRDESSSSAGSDHRTTESAADLVAIFDAMAESHRAAARARAEGNGSIEGGEGYGIRTPAVELRTPSDLDSHSPSRVRQKKNGPDRQIFRSVQEVFDRFVSPEPNTGCWLWTGYYSYNGYGRVRQNHRKTPAHRMVWELAHGPVPAGMFVLHRCDTRPCVNPDHLFLGTAQDNVNDMVSKGRSRFGGLPLSRCIETVGSGVKVHQCTRKKLAGSDYCRTHGVQRRAPNNDFEEAPDLEPVSDPFAW